ncbi:MAG: hypothetical protein HS122_04135 [Opitutaceae bacterium]|nr:hypothetical protein [Opitutaceae bacterium]
MNKIYLIVPIVLCALFGVYYYKFIQDEAVKTEQREKAAKIAKDEADAKKKEIEDKARKDADDRQQKRLADEKKKDDDRRAKWESQSREIAEATAKYSAEAAKYTKQIADLDAQLKETRLKKDTATRESFDLKKQVELALIAKRNAELEIQRMVSMVANKAAESAMARPPPPPPVEKGKSK